MDLISFAVKMEKDGEELYRKLAFESSSIGLRKVFKLMADEESKHVEAIENIKIEYKLDQPLASSFGPCNVYLELVDENSNFFVTEDEIELYKKCLEMERKSRDFYRDNMVKATDELEQKVLKRLSEEEQKHIDLLENIIEHVSYPDEHIEDAEFTHSNEE